MRLFLITGTLLLALTIPRTMSAGEAAAQELSFGDLSFAVTPPKTVVPPEATDPQPAYGDQIPERVRALDGRRISISGFMIPTRLEGDGVREFIIVSSPLMCCYGQAPEIYEYMVVRMVGKPAPMRENLPTAYEGILRVGDVYEHGYWTAIFTLECDGVKE